MLVWEVDMRRIGFLIGLAALVGSCDSRSPLDESKAELDDLKAVAESKDVPLPLHFGQIARSQSF